MSFQTFLSFLVLLKRHIELNHSFSNMDGSNNADGDQEDNANDDNIEDDVEIINDHTGSTDKYFLFCFCLEKLQYTSKKV